MTNTNTPMTEDEALAYSRGWDAGRQALDLTIHRKARAAYDFLAASVHRPSAEALWDEVARLQGIVCSACEASMEAHEAELTAEARLAALEAGVERLAAEWDDVLAPYASDARDDRIMVAAFRRASDELRALLRGEGDQTKLTGDANG